MAVDMNVEVGDIQTIADVLMSMSGRLEDKRTLNRIVFAVAAEGREQFGMHMDMVSRSAKERFNHLYEWDALGNKTGRLYRTILTRPAGGSMEARPEFLPSTKPLPERPLVGSRIPVQITQDDGTVVTRHMKVWARQHEHFFTQKAATMENGMTVEIEPVNASRLFWVDPENKVGFMRPSLTINYSDRPTAGAFAEMWNMFWETMAEVLVAEPLIEEFGPTLNAEISRVFQAAVNKSGAATAGPMRPGTTMTKNGAPFTTMTPKKHFPTERAVDSAVKRTTNKYG